MATVTINGNVINVSGGGTIGITSRNGKIIINGIEQASGLSGTVELKIEGAVADIEADGSVHCGNVAGKVSAGGSVTCQDVTGNVNAGGSAKAAKVGGSMNAGGSIRVGN